MSVIRTITGDIRPEELGVCDFHDHLIRSSGPELKVADYYLQDSIAAACMEVEDYMEAGGRAMVCMDPLGCGRDVPKMMEIAEKYRGKFQFIMCTGFHKGGYYDQRAHWTVQYRIEESARLVAQEVLEGMDIYNYSGPIINRGKARAGIIKAGTSHMCITPFEQRILKIVTEAQRLCSAPISIHTEMGTMGVEIIDFLKAEGADIEKVVLCHTNKVDDRYYYRKMLDRGVNLCFEGADRPMWGSDLKLAENIRWILEQGYADQILLAMDAGRSDWQKGYMSEKGAIAKGISYLLTDFLPLMKEIGITETDMDKMLVKNPARVLAIDND